MPFSIPTSCIPSGSCTWSVWMPCREKVGWGPLHGWQSHCFLVSYFPQGSVMCLVFITDSNDDNDSNDGCHGGSLFVLPDFVISPVYFLSTCHCARAIHTSLSSVRLFPHCRWWLVFEKLGVPFKLLRTTQWPEVEFGISSAQTLTYDLRHPLCSIYLDWAHHLGLYGSSPNLGPDLKPWLHCHSLVTRLCWQSESLLWILVAHCCFSSSAMSLVCQGHLVHP